MQQEFVIVAPADVGAAWDRARAELRARPLSIAPDMLPVVSARLACGDFETVRELLREAPPGAALPLIAARYHAWSGDLHTVMAVFEQVRAALPLIDQLQPALRLATWSELERTATDAGDPILASRLVARARAETVADPDIPTEAPAATVLDIAHDLLGIEPDAPRGRIRLRPHIGAHDAIDVRGIRFADGSLRLAVIRTDEGVEIRVEQDAGALPFTLILEAVVAVALGTAIDGRVADLQVRPHEHGVIVPVQLVLDDVRLLRVRTR
jgi:hypothetical protein